MRRLLQRTLLITAVALCAAGTAMFAESLRYPRIARSGYWLHPVLLVEACVGRWLPGDGVPRSEALRQAADLHPGTVLTVRLLYLSAEPVDGKSIRARVFGLEAKGWQDTSEELFWIVTAPRVQDDRPFLAFEYRTGRLVCDGGGYVGGPA